MVGIPLDTLIIMLLAAFVVPVLFFIFFWVIWIPKPAKTYAGAKLTKQDVNIEATDAGTLHFWRGKTEGPGVFYGKKDRVSFMHRSVEPWVNKKFSADRIGTILSYSGMAIQANPQHVGLLQTNQLLDADKELNKKKELDLSVLPDNIRKSLEPCFVNVTEGDVREAEAIGEETDLTKKQKALTGRRQVLLLDPRILNEANTQMVDPGQVHYVRTKAYNKGWEDRGTPLLKRALPLLLSIGLIMLAMALAVSGTAPAA